MGVGWTLGCGSVDDWIANVDYELGLWRPINDHHIIPGELSQVQLLVLAQLYR